MGSRLYVGNLSFNTSSSDLERLFGAFGVVDSTQVIQDRDSGRSKGFAFVEMSNDSEAQAAIKALDGQDLGGRPLTVNEARPRDERQGGGRGQFAGSSNNRGRARY